MTLDFGLELKSVTEVGSFEGLASVFGNVDLGGDVVERGAFAKDLRDNGSTRPLLWSHSMAESIGIGELSETDAGLHIRGKLLLDVVAGKEAYSRLKAGAAKGLSIGYVPTVKPEYRDGVRLLKELRLHEVSLTPVAMNPRAQVTGVKSAIVSVRDFERHLRDIGYSKAEATRLALHGFKGLGLEDEPDADESEALELLRSWNRRAA